MDAQSLVRSSDGTDRCWWCGDDPLYVDYHDSEWGRPVDNDTRLFEKICLEGFQAGLSWITILRKREAFRLAFSGFDIATVAAFGEPDVERLVQDASIIRHRGKIAAAIHNAERAMALGDEFGSLAAYFWRFEPEDRAVFKRRDEIPSETDVSRKLSNDLKRRGWKFVGPTTCYAFMQAMGMVNDHLAGCSRHAVSSELRESFRRPN